MYWGRSVYGFDAKFVPYVSVAVTEWLVSMVTLINALTVRFDEFYLGTIWINKEFYPSCIIPCCQAILGNLLPEWSHTSNFYSTVDFGDKVAAHRIERRIYKVLDIDYNLDKPYTSQHNIHEDHGYGPILSSELNNTTDLYSVVLPKNIMNLTPSSPSPRLSTPYALSLPLSKDASNSPEIVLHPSYPAIEPLCSGGGQL